MKLPNVYLALVEESKITEYLLNPAHPDSGGKAVFFQSLGFQQGQWQVLADAFRKLAQTGEISKSMESPHGQGSREAAKHGREVFRYNFPFDLAGQPLLD